MAQKPSVCKDCVWFHDNHGRPECRRWPPIAAPQYEAPILWEFPKVDPNNVDVCGEAATK